MRVMAIAMFVICALCLAAPIGAQTRPVHRPIALHNGKDLAGWYSYLRDTKREDPRKVFSVTEDGLLRISGDGYGYLATKESYADYHLVLEYKWGAFQHADMKGKARDSGVFLHAMGPDGNSFDGQGAFKAAIECNIHQGATGDLLLINGKDESDKPLLPSLMAVISGRDGQGYGYYDPIGALTRYSKGPARINWNGKSPKWEDKVDFRGAKDAESPHDQWTKLEVICAGDRIRVLVNGRAVNGASNVSPASGPILLQCEGSEVFFRRVELLPVKQ